MQLNLQEKNQLKGLLKKVKLKDIMTKNPVSIEVDDPFSWVEERMRLKKIRHLPVVDIDNKLVGIITERDLYRVQSPRLKPDGKDYYSKSSLDSHILSNVMTEKPFCLGPGKSLADAVIKIAYTKYGCIPIVDETKKLIGIVTQIDIIKAASRIFSVMKDCDISNGEVKPSLGTICFIVKGGLLYIN